MHWRDRSHRRVAYNEPGHGHELTFCCVHRLPFLRAERTCRWLAESIHQARKEHDFLVWAYVFMPDHVHIVIQPNKTQYDIRLILSAIKEPTGRAAIAYLRANSPEWIERLTVRKRRRAETRFWEPGGGFDRNITEARTLKKMIDYIHLNPVRKGFVQKAEEWKWSSSGWFAGLEPNCLRPDPIPPEWGIIE